mgnify:CR=1 FL=1|tara:strand:- start:441 stop:1076 length:636 start_codon:yes stop_codon:yes gene_type:complete
MDVRSISREIALITLGQISDKTNIDFSSISLDEILNSGITVLSDYWEELLEQSKDNIESANNYLLDSELCDFNQDSYSIARQSLKNCSNHLQLVLNGISECSEFSRILSLSDQDDIRKDAFKRVTLVLNDKNNIDQSIDGVMDGWRLKRLPRVDRDILRLAFVDLIKLHTPIPVACNEAVDLANRYSDEQGRKMINGVLRRLQTSNLVLKN